MKKVILLMAIPLVLLAALGLHLQTYFAIPDNQTDQTVFIPHGASLTAIARQLESQGIIESNWKLRLLARFQGATRAIKPGEYLIPAPTSPAEMLRILQEGKVVLHKVTFPEGITVKDVARILQEKGLVDAERFKTTLEDLSLLNRWGIVSPTYEGFLFPDTYLFSKSDGEVKIISAMLERFQNALTPEDRERMESIGGDLLSWATLASIIEKESGFPEEHKIISSVFYNRLRRSMRLQSDPTVIYGLSDFDGNLTRKHLQTDHPFNTYIRYGLPPHPIANPGATALHAAMNPAETEYFFFVSKNDGTHAFAKTYKEHQQNVIQYQLKGQSSRYPKSK